MPQDHEILRLIRALCKGQIKEEEITSFSSYPVEEKGIGAIEDFIHEGSRI